MSKRNKTINVWASPWRIKYSDTVLGSNHGGISQFSDHFPLKNIVSIAILYLSSPWKTSLTYTRKIEKRPVAGYSPQSIAAAVSMFTVARGSVNRVVFGHGGKVTSHQLMTHDHLRKLRPRDRPD